MEDSHIDLKKIELIHIFPSQQTQEICLNAVSCNGRELRFVSEANKTKEVCLAAVSNDPYAIHWVPKEMKNPEFYWEALGLNGNVLFFIPEESKTIELCFRALIGGCTITCIPKKFRGALSKIAQHRREIGSNILRYPLLVAWESG